MIRDGLLTCDCRKWDTTTGVRGIMLGKINKINLKWRRTKNIKVMVIQVMLCVSMFFHALPLVLSFVEHK